jgi:integrase
MSIHRTKSGTWRVYYRQNGRQRSKNLPTKAAAERFDAEVKLRILEGRPVTRKKDAPTLETLAIMWMADRDDLAPKTLMGYAHALEKHVIPFIGHLKVHGSELRPVTLDTWQRDRLESGAGPSVIRRAHIALSQIFDWAILPHELLESNPLAPVKPPKQDRTEPRYLTAVEVERVRRALIDTDDTGSAALVSTLAYVGIRPQDALALEWSDVGTELSVFRKNTDGTIIPGSKTGHAHRRRVNLPDPVRADLEGWRVEIGKPTTGLIFPRARDGKPWREDDYRNWRRRAFARAAQSAGLGSLNPYALRHTCASLLAAAGWTHLEIARQLGHSPETSVRVYQHLLDVGRGERLSIDEWITAAREEVAGKRDRQSVAE